MSDEEGQKKKQDAGAPAWVMTFADLMSLLMCFFVLLLSFSEMDVSKYKQIAGSMREAFGVQRKYNVKDPPKGINIIAKEFSAGKPEPTVFNVLEQKTTDIWQLHLKTGQDRRNRDNNKEDSKSGQAGTTKGQRQHKAQVSPNKAKKMVLLPKAEALELMKQRAAERKAQEAAKAEAMAEAKAQVEKTADMLRDVLQEDIAGGKLEIETMEQRIIIRLQDRASFPGGSVFIRDSFRPVLARVARVLKTTPGNIVVAGHSDNVPFTGDVYRSNWELSAGRAVSVVHELLDEGGLKTERITVEGRGDTQPLVPNDNPVNRARNRRVEIILAQGEDLFAESELSSSTIIAEPAAPADETPQQFEELDTDAVPDEPAPQLPASEAPSNDPFISGEAAGAVQGDTASNTAEPAQVITDPLAPASGDAFINPADGASE